MYLEQQTKELVRARDLFKCAECGLCQQDHVSKFGNKLAVHKINPAMPYSMDNCMTLCCVCHAAKPKGKNPPWLFDGILRLKPSDNDLLAIDATRIHMQQSKRKPLTREQTVYMLAQYYIQHEGLFDGERQRKIAEEKRLAHKANSREA